MQNQCIEYNQGLNDNDNIICSTLMNIINETLVSATNKLRHGHPVWFIDGNPIVGYSKRKTHIQLLFWSGQSFDVDGLQAIGKFKAAEIHYTELNQIDRNNIVEWLEKSKVIQRDYKNIVKRKGVLEKLVY